jgi:hypothetical protein
VYFFSLFRQDRFVSTGNPGCLFVFITLPLPDPCAIICQSLIAKADLESILRKTSVSPPLHPTALLTVYSLYTARPSYGKSEGSMAQAKELAERAAEGLKKQRVNK